MKNPRESGAGYPPSKTSALLVLTGPVALLVLTVPFVLAGSSLVVATFFYMLGLSVTMFLVSLAALLVNSRIRFVGVFILLTGFTMLFMFVPPFEWQYLDKLTSGAFAGCLLGLILAFRTLKRLPVR